MSRDYSAAVTEYSYESEEQAERRVSWVELFYDLVMVSSTFIIGQAFSAKPTWGMRFWVDAVIAGFFVVWLLTTLSFSCFDKVGMTRRVLVFVEMIGVSIALLSVSPEPTLPPEAGALSIALVLGAVATIYVFIYRTQGRELTGRGRRAVLVAIAITLVSAALGVLSALTSFVPSGVETGIVLVVLIVPFLVVFLPSVMSSTLVVHRHLGERLGQLTLIFLGAGFIDLVYDVREARELDGPPFFLLAFIFVILCWQAYYAVCLIVPVESPKHPVVWVLSHFFFFIGVSAFVAALGRGAITSMSQPLEDGWMRPGVAAALVLLGLSGLSWSGRGRMGRWGWVLLGLTPIVVLGAFASDIVRNPDLQVFTAILVVMLVTLLVALVITERRAARALSVDLEWEAD